MTTGESRAATEDPSAAIADAYAAVTSAEAAGRWEEIGRYYDDRASVVIPRYAPGDRDSVPEALQERAPVGSYVAEERYIPLDLIVAGNYAYDTESVGMIIKAIADRNRRTAGRLVGMRALTVWKKEPDGRWRILREMFDDT